MVKGKQKDSSQNSLISASEPPLIQTDETLVFKRRENPHHESQLKDLLSDLEAMFESKISDKIKNLFGEDFLSGMGNDDNIPEESKQRIVEVLEDDDLDLSDENLKKYLAFLKKTVKLPCLLVVDRPFQWEEEYLTGKKKREYEKFKRSRPSLGDEFELTNFEDKFSEEDGLMVKVKRVSDGREFVVDLYSMTVKDHQSPSYEPIQDYLNWLELYY